MLKTHKNGLRTSPGKLLHSETTYQLSHPVTFEHN